MKDEQVAPLVLAAEFQPSTEEQWRKRVDDVLAGARFEDRLQSKTADGLTISPIYRRHETASPHAARASGTRWQVMQRIELPDPAMANAEVRHELANGATGLVLVGAGAIGAHGYGLPPPPDVMERVFDGVELGSGISIEFDLSPATKELPLALAALIRSRGIPPSAAAIRFGFDPLGAVAFNGGFPMPWNELAPLVARLASDLAAQGFQRHLTAVDGRIVHGAGGTPAQELAYMLAVAIAYLRAFETAGIALDDARRMIFFRLTTDADQFLSIAKLRALRSLWRSVEESCGLAPEPAFISAETAWCTMTRDDPYLNILRATIAVFAAGVGGADAITVLPFTIARGLPDRFARRVARNTQLVLLDEANLARVADPAAGTGWLEAHSQDLSAAAWTLFQEIEAAGGAATALEQGLIQRQVAAARSVRQRALAARTDVLLGANEFRTSAPIDVAVLDVPRVTQPAVPIHVPIEPLHPIRFAAPFEQR
jgi:methylmalonyl-CoA mutase